MVPSRVAGLWLDVVSGPNATWLRLARLWANARGRDGSVRKVMAADIGSGKPEWASGAAWGGRGLGKGAAMTRPWPTSGNNLLTRRGCNYPDRRNRLHVPKTHGQPDHGQTAGHQISKLIAPHWRWLRTTGWGHEKQVDRLLDLDDARLILRAAVYGLWPLAPCRPDCMTNCDASPGTGRVSQVPASRQFVF